MTQRFQNIAFFFKQHLFLILAIVVFIILKFPVLHLPFYWDEAWSYTPAVFEMFKDGPSLSPSSLSPSMSRGHPLMFYFLSSGWATIFGFSTLSMHCFALFVTITLSILLYKILNDFVGGYAGIFAILLLFSNHVFFVQSTFLLPEMLLSLTALISVLCYLHNKIIPFIICTSIALLTKETAIVLIPSLFVLELIQFSINIKSKGFKKALLKLRDRIEIIAIPFLILCGFFIIQYIQRGWFFFPEHTGYIDLDPNTIHKKFEGLKKITFTESYKWVYLFIAGIVAIMGIILKKRFTRSRLNLLIAFVLIMVFFTGFSVINFATLRYYLFIISFWLVLSAVLIDYLTINKYIKFGTIALLTILNIWYTITYNKNSDISINYADTVVLYQDAVDYLEENNHYDDLIVTSFLMINYLKHPEIGYLSTDKKFKTINHITDDCELYVTSPFLKREFYIYAKENGELLKRFANEYMWIEIYKKPQ